MDSDQDYVFIETKVSIGKSYKSKGWALSREDIHDWIPVEEFERDCQVVINGISSEAIIRFNPRLFYESNELSAYLKEFYDKGLSKEKLPMKIKVNKNNFYSNLSSEHKPSFNNLDTTLLVGKSYSSKGWQLSHDVVSQLFPVGEYYDEYLISINGIESNANLNCQMRLFYKSDELSNYLEELYHENPRQRVDAKIIFENTNQNEKSESNSNICEEETSNEFNQLLCDICDESYSDKNELADNRFPNSCPNCIEKIHALEAYNKIKNESFSNFVKKEFIQDAFISNFNYIWELLIKYEFLVPFGDLFKLNNNELLEKKYSKFLSNNLNESIPTKRRNRDAFLELIEEQEGIEEKNTCNICGSVLNNNEINKCDICRDKQLATEYLHNVVLRIPYEKNFSKSDFKRFSKDSLNSELILDKLVQYDLVMSDGSMNYKLNDVSFLNEFVNKFSDNPYELQVNYRTEGSDVPCISKNDLYSEEEIDSVIKWKDFWNYISFKKGRYGFVSVQFKRDGKFLYSKGFETSYEAKIEAINYLQSWGELILVDDKDIKLIIK